MAFFDDVKKNLTQAGQNAAQKAKDLTESASLNRAIADNDKKIKTLLLQLGTEFYEKNAENPAEEYADIFAEIAEIKKDSAEKQARLDALNQGPVCPNCGEKVAPDALFCSRCGTKIEQPQPEEIVCPNCEKTMPQGSAFCSYCGTKF